MMRSTTESKEETIAYDSRDTRETPKIVAEVTWATIALLVLIMILGALFLSGFFASLTSGPGNGQGRPLSSSSPPAQTR